MRQPSIILLLISLTCFICLSPVYSAVKGGIQYTIPTDYSKLSEQEIELKARRYFFLAQKVKGSNINEDVTNALMLYSILERINPENIEYPVKLAILYDKLDKQKYARGCFAKAIGIDSSKPEPYFYYGEFYYKRQMYRRALEYYNNAYKFGYSSNYDLLYRIGDIYEKFGDTKSALKYLNAATLQNPNPELQNKIKRIEAADSINKEYYSDTRLRG